METVTLNDTGRYIDGDSDTDWHREIEGESDTGCYSGIDEWSQ